MDAEAPTGEMLCGIFLHKLSCMEVRTTCSQARHKTLPWECSLKALLSSTPEASLSGSGVLCLPGEVDLSSISCTENYATSLFTLTLLFPSNRDLSIHIQVILSSDYPPLSRFPCTHSAQSHRFRPFSVPLETLQPGGWVR